MTTSTPCAVFWYYSHYSLWGRPRRPFSVFSNFFFKYDDVWNICIDQRFGKLSSIVLCWSHLNPMCLWIIFCLLPGYKERPGVKINNKWRGWVVKTTLDAANRSFCTSVLVYFVLRYGRVYATAADPYHHSVGPTTTYGVGTVVSCHARTHTHTHTHTDKAWASVQQASLYRGGYNRFTPYWDGARPPLWDRLIHRRCSTDEKIPQVFGSVRLASSPE